MEELERLKVILEAELAPYKEQLNEAKRETTAMATEVTNQTGRIKQAFSSMGSFIKRALVGLGLFKLGKQALELGKQALEMASDVKETEGVVDLAFGNMRKVIDDFAKNSIQTHGMNALSAKQTAGDYMLMSNGMNIAKDKAAIMAVEVTKLGADMASLKNTTREMAATALTGIWTGETEALKRYGVVMTQANLQEFAYRNNVRGKIQDLSQQEQVMLRYAFVMDAMRLAQGNFQRESQGWAAQTKILGEQWKDLITIIGQGLMVVLLPVLRFINKVMGYLIAFARAVGQVFSRLFGIKSSAGSASVAIGGLSNSTQKANTSLGNLGGGVGDLGKKLNKVGNRGSKDLGRVGKSADKAGKDAEKAGKKAKGALAPFDDLNVLVNNTADSLGKNSSLPDIKSPKSPGLGNLGDVGGLGGLGDLGDFGLGDFGDAFSIPEIDTSNIDKFADKLYDTIMKIKSFLEEHKVGITSFLAGLIAAIFAGFRTFRWALTHPISALKGAWFMAMESIKGSLAVINAPALALSVIIGLIVAAVVYLWQTSESFRDSVIDTWNRIKDLFVTVFEGIKTEIQQFWEEYGKPIMQGLSDAWQNFVKIVDQLWQGVLKPIIDTIISVLKSLWSNVLQPVFSVILTVIGEVIEIVLKLWNDVLAPLIQWILENIAPVIKRELEKFAKSWQNLTAAIKPMIEEIERKIKLILDILKLVIDFFVKVFKGDWEGVWKDVEEIAKKAWELISGAWKFAGEWFSNNVVQPIKRFFTDLWSNVSNKATEIWSKIQGTWRAAGAWFRTNVTDPIRNFFKDAWQNIGDFIKEKWDWILGLFSKGGKIFTGVVDGVAGVFKRIVNAIISGINRVIRVPFDIINGTLNKIREIQILKFKPFAGLWGYNPIGVPQIPHLSVGTNYVARDGLAMIHQGEAVVPKKYNPALGGNIEQIEILEEQNSLLRQILEKDGNTYLDGEKLHQNNEKRKRKEFDRYGYSL